MSSSLGRSSSTSAISSANGDTKKALMPDLDRPQYNSSLKLIKKLDEINIGNSSNNSNANKMLLANNQLEKINEKASQKLNLRGQIFEGLVSVEPNQEDFIKYLEIKHKSRVRPQIQQKNNQKAPDLMEFYPFDLIKEHAEVDIEPTKQAKFSTIKASSNLTNDPIAKYFYWN